MKYQTLVSVIVPIYKVEQFIDECVTSIRHQTHTNLEIILVDDGSPDNCPVICDNYAEADSRIRVVHKNNGGLSSARNAGLDVATGEYVTFVDSDDVINKNTIEKAVELADANRAEVVCYNFKRFYVKQPGDDLFSQPLDFHIIDSMELLKEVLSQKQNCSSCTRLYKREIIGDLRFYEGRNNEDILFLFYLLKRHCRALITNAVFYYYRVNHGSISNNGRDFNDILLNISEMMTVNKEQFLGLDEVLHAREQYFNIQIAYSIWRKKWTTTLKDVYTRCCLYVHHNLFRILFKSDLSIRNRINALIVFFVSRKL